MRDQTLSHSGIEIPGNPFSEDVFDDHSENLPGVEQMHYQTFSKIVEDVESLVIHSHESRESAQLGKTILVTAPTRWIWKVAPRCTPSAASAFCCDHFDSST